MINRKTFFILILFLCAQSICTISLKEQLSQVGYVEICDKNHGSVTYDSLYVCFDELITFLQANPTWAQKLYIAKERFIRTEYRNYYSTDFFGFYDESERKGRNQIAFYYSVHFQDFIFSYYPEFKQIPQIVHFFESCRAIEQSSRNVCNEAAAQLHLENIFSLPYGHPPILLKVIKYLPSYNVSRPHYDGTAFSLFLDSTDNESLLLSPYKSEFTVENFFSPVRMFSRLDNQNSMLLIPGTCLTEFFLYPTPHIVAKSGKTRYSTIAFAMRPHYTSSKNSFSLLPDFKY
jgi:hypothetical protein